MGCFNDYDKLCDQLCFTFKDVAKSEIAKDEEGNVLYLIARGGTASTDGTILSLAKLKTLEYRLFRKMREKLRGFFCLPVSKQDPDRLSKPINDKFRNEAKALSDEHELPRPLDYYIALFETAFVFIQEQRESRSELLHKEYVTFSEQLL